MVVNSTEAQNNFGKYLELAAEKEIIIVKNGIPVARLLGMNETVSFLSDRLVGIVPSRVNEKSEKEKRLKRQ